MAQRTVRGKTRENPRMTGADGVSVLPAAMVAALVAGGIAISQSLRKSRAAAPRVATSRAASPRGEAPQAAATRQGAEQQGTERQAAPAGHRASAPGPTVPSGQTAVRPTVDDDGR